LPALHSLLGNGWHCFTFLSGLHKEGGKDFFSFKISLQANQHCVTGNVLPTYSWLSGSDLEHVLAAASI